MMATHEGYRIGSYRDLSSAQLGQLTALIGKPPGVSPPKLAGRAPICRDEIDGLGRVAVKTYCRGGLIKHISRYRYLRTGKPRCRREFEMLATVRGAGVNAPEPIAFAYRGRITYRGWLITREVKDPRSLIDVCKENNRLCRDSIAAVAQQIQGLIENRIRHADLHPGNVLLDVRNRAYIIDFDRARATGWSREALQNHYISRWSRSINKHKLPSLLSKELQSFLSTSTKSR
jgi:tRNA A-37 threonylcarbamoyl transferase component Bud32